MMRNETTINDHLYPLIYLKAPVYTNLGQLSWFRYGGVEMLLPDVSRLIDSKNCQKCHSLSLNIL